MGGAARTWMTAVPLFPVVLGAGLVLSAVFARSLATRLRMPDWVVLGILASLSLIAAATLSPGADGVWGSCLRDVAHPLGRGLLAGGDRSLNTWLFVPLGFFSALGARAHPGCSRPHSRCPSWWRAPSGCCRGWGGVASSRTLWTTPGVLSWGRLLDC